MGVFASISAICLRACWTQGAIKDTYIKSEGAAVTYLGRILCDLPLTGQRAVKFDTLPLVWGRNMTNERVRRALRIAYPVVDDPKFPAVARGLFMRMLATPVKNVWWLQSVLGGLDDDDTIRLNSGNHPVTSTLFYTNKEAERLHDLLARHRP